MNDNLASYCAVTGRTELLRQWDGARNGPLSPSDVTLGSHRKVWWVCEKGHVWQAEVKRRMGGSCCPVCANRRIAPGENDLATTNPELAKQWHPTFNNKLTPRDVVAGNSRKVWWLCEKGHTWQAAVSSRARGAGCPYCAGRRVLPGYNDLATAFPRVAAQWHPTKNAPLTPSQVTAACNRKVWWRCPQGHDYQTTIAIRTVRDTGCPYCSGRRVLAGFNDLATVEPRVAEQWHPTLNGSLTPQQVTACSHRQVWWQCPEGHVWKTVVYSRAGPMKSGCPVCAGRESAKRQQARYAAFMNEPHV